MGPAGPTGLDYGAIDPVLRLHGVKKRERRDLFEALRIMESAVLDVMRERAK